MNKDATIKLFWKTINGGCREGKQSVKILIFQAFNSKFAVENRLKNLPYLDIETNPKGEWGIVTGIDSFLLSALARNFNFTWKIKYNNMQWGAKMPNGSWTGTVNLVMNDVSPYYEN